MKLKDYNRRYAEREVTLAKLYLTANPEDTAQKDRLAYWSAYLGDYETADHYAVSDKTKSLIQDLKNKDAV